MLLSGRIAGVINEVKVRSSVIVISQEGEVEKKLLLQLVIYIYIMYKMQRLHYFWEKIMKFCTARNSRVKLMQCEECTATKR